MIHRSTHPYSHLNDSHFWSRSVSNLALHEINPTETPSQQISRDASFASMGSCFAQHVARSIEDAGLNYLITESPRKRLSPQERIRGNWDVFSARYGNVYTARQGLQLAERALGLRESSAEIWRAEAGIVDPHRPSIDPDGFLTLEEMELERSRHLEATRRMITEAEVLVFTLGLTESWESREDGSCFPIAPGVVGGEYDPSIHQFANHSVNNVIADLTRFIELTRAVNPSLRYILTVSPVPLAATYSSHHVLAATMHSKSILLVAARTIESTFSYVDYFPSLEMITGLHAGNVHFEDGLRTVRQSGVKLVMTRFLEHFVASPPDTYALPSVEDSFQTEKRMVQAVICDEALLDLPDF